MPIEIDAHSNLWLPCEGDGDRDTFAQVFREVWCMIPVKYRESMVREWRKGIVGQVSSPVIDLRAAIGMRARTRRLVTSFCSTQT